MQFFLTIITFILPANCRRIEYPGTGKEWVKKPGAYGLWNMNITLRFLNNYQLKGGIHNIANNQYFTKRPTFYPGPGIGELTAVKGIIPVGCRL